MLVTAGKLIGAGCALVSLSGVAVGIGCVFGALMRALARNPSIKPELMGLGILGFALTEAMGLFALRRALLILFGF